MSLVPIAPGNRRTIHFLEDGIGLRDENGDVLVPPNASVGEKFDREGIWRRREFRYLRDASILDEIWRTERAKIAARSAPDTFSSG